ncbi:MAG: UDP-N-acetylglucosamine--N-acetylmuramyl-(pentapeptide) pyrophosphoryl-undecaprenol N-acetylglucosamine transferase [Patescibacteria group bacterium]
MKIIFSGGGTLGPVTPLLAIHESIKEAYPDASIVWVGTALGPEKALVHKQGIRFVTISSGKFRRYLSPWNLTDILRIIIGFFQSLVLLWKEDPDCCISAGGFISVPLHTAAWLLGIPTWIHVQDVRPGLAIEFMAPLARLITVSLKENVKKFPKRKVVWLGNPVRRSVFSGSRDAGIKRFDLDSALPTVFVLGGGTGSLRVNQLFAEALGHIAGSCNIIHLSGKERPHEMIDRAATIFPHYHTYQFFTDEMADAYAVADVVVARAGFGTLAELALLKKAAILIPKGGHQEENVDMLIRSNAALSLNEKAANGYELAQMIKKLLIDAGKRKQLGDRLHELLPAADTAVIKDMLKSVVGTNAP